MKLLISLMAVVLLNVNILAADPKGQSAFLDGLDHLDSGKWADATAAFARAINEDEEAPRYYLARGVSRLLAEDLKGAIGDFDRVLRFDPGDKHAKLWKAVATNMQGRFMDGSLIYPAATRDQYENQIQDMARLYGQLNFVRSSGDSDPEWDKKWEADHAAAKAKFPEIARLFIGRVKGKSTDLAPMVLDRAKKKMAAGDYANALAELQRAAEASPNDLNIVQARGVCNLMLNSPAAARANFVRVLTGQSFNAEAWNGHAMACVMLGDTERAKASLENAAVLNPQQASAWRGAFAELAKANPEPNVSREGLGQMATTFNRLAGENETSEKMRAYAAWIIRAGNAYRLRADESYLDKRLKFEMAVKANPRSAGALADLGEYLYTQAVSIRGEMVEPRSAFTTYRTQTDQTQQEELRLAEQTLANALQVEPRNVKALTFKAACAIFRRQWSDAETLLRQALSVSSTYGPLLEMFAKVMDHAAGVKSMAAADLRSVKSWEDAYYYYYRRPSQAELQAADEYQRQANALWVLAEQHIEAAAKSGAGKPSGFYYSGVLAKRRGQGEQAIAAFEKCVALAPDHASAWDELTELYHRTGRVMEAAGAKSAASNLQHTTAGHFLRYSWGQIVRTTYKSAAETLGRALAVDPADPRGYAYMAVIAQAKGDNAAALAWWRCAGALEEMHAQFHGVNFRSASTELIDPVLAGRAMAVNIRLGRLALEQNKPDVAHDAFNANLAIGQRFAKMERFTPLASSQLPDQQTDLTNIPEADSGLSLIAWSMLGVGESLMKQGKEAEAMKVLADVRQLPSQVPPTIDHRNRLADQGTLATIAMLKPLVERKEFKKAQDIYRSGGIAGAATKEYGDELRRLTKLIDDQLGKQRMDDADRESGDARRRQMEEFEKYRREQQEYDRKRGRQPR